jgi:lipoprotein-releasing system permease protein
MSTPPPSAPESASDVPEARTRPVASAAVSDSGAAGGLAWFLARRYLSSSRGGPFLSFITWIALGGIVVGVTALVVVIGVMTGMQEDLRGKILESSPHVLVLQQGSSLRMQNWQATLADVKSVDGVFGAAPFVLSQVTILRGNYAQPSDMYGVELDPDGPPVTEMERKIQDGIHELGTTASGLPPLLMGSRLAARMAVFPGDTLTLIAYENTKLDPFLGTPVPSMRQYEVTGTFTTGMYDYDIKNVYVKLEDAQGQLGIRESDEISGLGVRTDDPEIARSVAAAIRERLGLRFYAESWTVTNAALFSALKLEKLAMGLILSLIIVVAAFNIVSTLVMVVVDRTREIGILKSMGMPDRGILKVFMLQGLWIGVIGTVAGTGLGVTLAWLLDTYEIIRIPPDVYFVDRLPVSIYAQDILMIVAVSILIAFLATIYPAFRASRLQPVDAIRHE